MSTPILKRVMNWRAALVVDGAAPILAKVQQASSMQFVLLCANELRMNEQFVIFLDVPNSAGKAHDYITAKVKISASVLVAGEFRCIAKVTQIESSQLSLLNRILELLR
jgi:hypothetical protein